MTFRQTSSDDSLGTESAVEKRIRLRPDRGRITADSAVGRFFRVTRLELVTIQNGFQEIHGMGSSEKLRK